MYIIYLYIIYILFISLVRRFKNSSPTDPPHVCYDLIVICYLLCFRPYRAASSGRADMCYDLIVICYLLFVMIAPAQGCLVGAHRHVLRPYC